MVACVGRCLGRVGRYCHRRPLRLPELRSVTVVGYPNRDMFIRRVLGVPLVVPDAKQAIWKRFPAQLQLWPSLGATPVTVFGSEAEHATA